MTTIRAYSDVLVVSKLDRLARSDPGRPGAGDA